MQELTYGNLPIYKDFSDAFEKHCLGGIFRIRGMKRLDAIYPNGDVDLDKTRLWNILLQCERDWRSNHELGDFASEVLTILGFNWI
jgi:hypothetical protein